MRLLVLVGCVVAGCLTVVAASPDQPNVGGIQGGAVNGTPEAPQSPPPSPGAVRVGGTISPPKRIKSANPQYPPIAQSARVQGVVIIEATISPTGDVTNARVLRSIPLLDQAALDAVRQWQYEPTLLNGAPVAIIMTVTVQFSLPTDAAPRPCSLEPNLKAPASTAPTSLRFVNQSGQPRKLYRLDATGRRVWELTLGEAGTIEQSTFVDQAWVVTNAGDECLGIYLAEPARLTVTLRDATGPAQ